MRALIALALLALQRGSAAAPWNLSAACTTPYNYTATSWDNTCGDPGDGSYAFHDGWMACQNYTNVVPSIMIRDSFFGDNASTLVPALISGKGSVCGSERAPAGSCLAGTTSTVTWHCQKLLPPAPSPAVARFDKTMPDWKCVAAC